LFSIVIACILALKLIIQFCTKVNHSDRLLNVLSFLYRKRISDSGGDIYPFFRQQCCAWMQVAKVSKGSGSPGLRGRSPAARAILYNSLGHCSEYGLLKITYVIDTIKK